MSNEGLNQFHVYLCGVMPQLPSVILPNGIVVYTWHITETQDSLKQRYEECLLESRNTKSALKTSSLIASSNQSHRSQSYQPLEEFTVSVDHKHFLASRLLLHSVFGNHQLVRDDHGKPHLTSTDQVHIHSANTHINYSHANDWVVLACHNQFSVGIDIESARPQLHRIYKRFCSSKEME